MALIIADGFDLYRTNQPADWTTVGEWSFLNGAYGQIPYGSSTTLTRFGVGKSARFDYLYGAGFGKTGVQTTNTVYMSLAFYAEATTLNWEWFQGGTAQVRAIYTGGGQIDFYRGPGTTYLGSWTGFSNYAWHHIQIRVVINGSTGEIRGRKNGSATDDFVLTGINTQNTANAWADQWSFYHTGTAGASSYMDDLLLYDNSGSNFNTWSGDVRCHTLLPSGAGSTTNFTSVIQSAYVMYPGDGRTTTRNSTRMNYTPFTPPVSGTLSKLTFHNPANQTGNIRLALYANNVMTPTVPGALVQILPAATNPNAGYVDFVLSPGVSVTAGQQYWAAIQSSMTRTYYWQGTGKGHDIPGYDNFPANYPTPGYSSFDDDTFAFTYTLTDISASDPLTSYDLDTSYAYSSIPTAHDLFTMADLPSAPSGILAVIPRAFIRKSDAGTRMVQAEIKSGSTTAQGTAVNLGTTYGNVKHMWTTDPNTGTAWTASAVNSLEAGYKISS